MADRRERQQAQMALRARKKRLGGLAKLDVDDADEVTPATTFAEADAAIGKLAKKKSTNKLSGEELEKWKKNRARVKEIRERQADVGYYTVLVFDTRGQCQAFVDWLVAKHIIGRDGDLFIDGRHVAEALGVKLPPPEYEMTTSVALSQGETKAMLKIPKGAAK